MGVTDSIRNIEVRFRTFIAENLAKPVFAKKTNAMGILNPVHPGCLLFHAANFYERMASA